MLATYRKRRKTLKRKLEKWIRKPALRINQQKPFEEQIIELHKKKEGLIETGGIKTKIQSYDIMDAEEYEGISGIMKAL